MPNNQFNKSGQKIQGPNNSAVFGFDIAYNVSTNDLNMIDSIVSGNELVGQRIARMLTTPTGALASIDPDPAAQSWGYDCNTLINGQYTTGQKSQIQAAIINAINMDQDVQSNNTTLNINSDGLVTIHCVITTALGPFSLVLNINDVSASVVFNSGVLGNQQ